MRVIRLLLLAVIIALAARPPIGDYHDAKHKLISYGRNLAALTQLSEAALGLIAFGVLAGFPNFWLWLLVLMFAAGGISLTIALLEQRQCLTGSVFPASRDRFNRAEWSILWKSAWSGPITIFFSVFWVISSVLLGDLRWMDDPLISRWLDREEQNRLLLVHHVLPQ